MSVGSTNTDHQSKHLASEVSRNLRKQGFRVCDGRILPPKDLTKEKRRRLHSIAVQHLRAERGRHLCRYENDLLQRIACGGDVKPECVRPKLVEVESGSDDELLFRYACLHWSIPVSSGYGRRLRFLVIDDYNDKLIGLFGLCDPVYAVRDRDHWIGWRRDAKRERLRYVMEAFVLGAVPPYARLLGGKLTAMLVASDEVLSAFRRKYGRGASVIRNENADGRLVMITTTSALGRSSIYNRITYANRTLYQSVGFTSGWGEFQFTNGLYSRLRAYAAEHCTPTAKQDKWGAGFRNRREVIRKALTHLGFVSDQYLNHGVKRELFAVPLAYNTRPFLRGEHERVQWHHQKTLDLFAHFRERWLLPRAGRVDDWAQWQRENYRLWDGNQ